MFEYSYFSHFFLITMNLIDPFMVLSKRIESNFIENHIKGKIRWTKPFI